MRALRRSTSTSTVALIASVSDASHPSWRARSLSVYRFWRDMGYAIGALAAGIISDLFGAAWAITSIGALTFASGALVAIIMREQMRRLDHELLMGDLDSQTLSCAWRLTKAMVRETRRFWPFGFSRANWLKKVPTMRTRARLCDYLLRRGPRAIGQGDIARVPVGVRRGLTRRAYPLGVPGSCGGEARRSGQHLYYSKQRAGRPRSNHHRPLADRSTD